MYIVVFMPQVLARIAGLCGVTIAFRWLIFARLSVVVDDDKEQDELRDLVQCDRLWLISPIQTRKALPHSGHW